jgi:hypothetical protein
MTQQPNQPPQPPRKSLITYPYRGVRRSYFVYHPAYDGPRDQDGQWDKIAKVFRQKLDDFCDVCELYGDQQTMSEVVGGSKWKKDVLKLFNAIEKDGKDIYYLEALAEQIFDVEDRTSQRVLPYHDELKTRVSNLKLEDLGLSTDGHLVNPKGIVQRGWAS